MAITCHTQAKDFSRAMPDEWKFDDTIDTFTDDTNGILHLNHGCAIITYVFLNVNQNGYRKSTKSC